jgi:hypothetical protein
MGFTYRCSEINDEGLVIHEGWYALRWKKRIIPKSQVIGVESYDGVRCGHLGAGVRTSGIRVRLRDGTAVVLTQSDSGRKSKFDSKVEEVRRALESRPD